jgi:hypothetical protein
MSDARRAYDEHVHDHGCGCPGRSKYQRHFCELPVQHERLGGHAIPGSYHCPAARALLSFVPMDERPIAIG